MGILVISQGKSYVARQVSIELGDLSGIAYGGF